MKNLLTAISFFGLFLTMHGQKVTVSELFKYQKNDPEYFESAALKNGFEYTSTEDSTDANIITYSFYQLKGTRSAHSLSYYAWKNDFRTVTYQTTVREEYIALKIEAKKLGFKIYKTQRIKNEIEECYKKNELCVCFNTSINQPDPETTIFLIDVRPSAVVQD